jgi:ribonuclease BN (tRNA processing enzyme)
VAAVRLTVVGCSGSFPQPDAAASCYLVEADDDAGRTWRVLLDLGSGALGPLQRHADLHALDAVLLSHLHPDHCIDLTACTWPGATTRRGPLLAVCPCTDRQAPCAG